MKVKKVPISETEYQFHILCPGCGQEHAFNNDWEFNNDFEKPTIRPSLLIRGWLNKDIPNGVCHSYITNGMIEFLGDCSHNLKGQMVPLLDINP